MKFEKNFILTILSPLVFSGVMMGIIPSILIFAVMLYGVFNLNRHEAIIVISFSFRPVLGVLFSIYNIGIPGSLVCLLLSLFLSLKDLKILLANNLTSLKYIAFMWFIMFLFYIVTGKTENSTEKIIVLTQLTIFNLLSVFVLSTFSDIKPRQIAPLFLYAGIFFIAAAHDYYGYPMMTNLFDFETFRLVSEERMHSLLPFVGYHLPGILCIFALSYFFSVEKKMKLDSWVLLAISMWIALVSGARQSILGIIIVFGAWIVLRNGKGIKMSSIIFSVILISLLMFILYSFEFEIFYSFFQKDSTVQESLNRDWEYPLLIILTNFNYGVGFGNYENPFIENEVYPHNLILEIMCEMGALGMLIIIIVLAFWLIRERPHFMQKLNSGSIAMILFLPYFIRSMISEDLSHNFILFIVVFSFFTAKSLYKKDGVRQFSIARNSSKS